MHPAMAAVIILGPYGLVFLGTTFLLRVSEASTVVSRLLRRR